MLISTVLSPDIFDPARFQDPLYRLSVDHLLRGIHSNGLVICDQDRILLKRIRSHTLKLQLANAGKNTTLLWSEIDKKDSSKTTRFVQAKCRVASEQNDIQLVESIAHNCKPDAVIVASPEVKMHLPTDCISLPVVNYMASSLEQNRRFYAEGDFESCDQMGEVAFKQMIGKASRFSKQLRIYDKYIGRAGNSLPSFLEGIRLVIESWLSTAYFPNVELKLEIYTVGHSKSKDQPLTYSEAYSIVTDQLCNVLKNEFGIAVTLVFKRESDGICHPRHLATDSCTIQFERGFDFVNPQSSGKRFKRSFINHVPKGDYHLLDYRLLKDCFPSRW